MKQIKRTKQEIEHIKEVCDVNDILDFMLSMGLTPRRYLASWEITLLIERAKEVNIRGMREFLEFGDYSWIGRRSATKDYRKSHNKASLGKGIISGSVALPRNNNAGGGFSYHGHKKSKRDNSSKIHNNGES